MVAKGYQDSDCYVCEEHSSHGKLDSFGSENFSDNGHDSLNDISDSHSLSCFSSKNSEEKSVEINVEDTNQPNKI